jgi:DegV family protein with EDD domain
MGDIMIHFIVDSTFCVDEEYKQKHDIQVVGLTVLLDGKVYNEDNTTTWGEYYDALKSSKSFPKTTQPSPEVFTKAIDEILAKDDDAEIIILTLTQSFSGTYNCAKMVAENYNGKVTVIDSECACESSLLMLEELVEARDNGKTVEEIVKLAESLKPKLSVQFVPTTLEYLRKGGRISLIKSVIANILNLKPIIKTKQGVLSNPKKCLGVKKAITEMIGEFAGKVAKVYVVYVYESPFLNEVIEKAKQTFTGIKIEARSVSPVIGSHVGIGAVGIACLEK